MTESKLIPIGKIKPNKDNPRIIKDDKFKKLVKSIEDFPKMLELRPIVVNDDMVVLGGNMRLRACKEAGLTEVPIIMANELTEEQQREFIIKDNVGFGDWDWDMIANEWDSELLNEWSLDVWQPEENLELDDFFEQENEIEDSKIELNAIVLNYSEDDYNLIIEELKNRSGTKEEIVFSLLIKK
ncbi:ParB N-terminal domain-containing protein [Winogradskyella sp.]|nr:ParB N-terminal domain-containing protein [Winogradskyella sp.]